MPPQSPGGRPPRYSHVRCRGGRFTPLRRLAKYYSSCAAAHAATTEGICPSGCLGIGDCLARCPEQALSLSPAGLAQVDRTRCIGCGRCLAACPRRVLSLVDGGQRTIVSCRSHLPVSEQDHFCPRGCTGCGRCVAVCPSLAVTIRDALAYIDRRRCTGCGLCVEWCPQQCVAYGSLGGKFAPTNPLAHSIVIPS